MKHRKTKKGKKHQGQCKRQDKVGLTYLNGIPKGEKRERSKGNI